MLLEKKKIHDLNLLQNGRRRKEWLQKTKLWSCRIMGWWGEEEFVELDSSASTAGQVQRSSFSVTVIPAMQFMSPICDMSIVHTQKIENDP